MKTTPPQKAIGKDPDRERILKDLRTAEKSLPTEVLRQFLEMAQEVLAREKHRKILEAQEAIVAPTPKVRVSKKAASSLEIEGEGNIFTFVTAKGRSMFGRPEVGALAKIANAGGSREDRIVRIFQWLLRERKDFLMNNGIGQAGDPVLKKLEELLRARFKIG